MYSVKQFISSLNVSLRLAWRSGFASVVFWLFITTVLVSWMASVFSARQQVVVALDVGISVVRLLLPLVVVVLVQELFSREFEKRNYLISLSYPVSRKLYVGGRILIIIFLVWSSLFFLSAALGFLINLLGVSSGGQSVSLGWQYVVTFGFVAVDLLVLILISSLLALVASTPSFVFIGTFGFMFIARSYSGILELLDSAGGLVDDPQSYSNGLAVLNYLVPNLGGLDVRMIALYGDWRFLPTNWAWLLSSILVFAASVFMVILWVVSRKRFS